MKISSADSKSMTLNYYRIKRISVLDRKHFKDFQPEQLLVTCYSQAASCTLLPEKIINLNLFKSAKTIPLIF